MVLDTARQAAGRTSGTGQDMRQEVLLLSRWRSGHAAEEKDRVVGDPGPAKASVSLEHPKGKTGTGSCGHQPGTALSQEGV